MHNCIVRYSPLCDVDRTAYLKYLETAGRNDVLSHARFERAGTRGGRSALRRSFGSGSMDRLCNGCVAVRDRQSLVGCGGHSACCCKFSSCNGDSDGATYGMVAGAGSIHAIEDGVVGSGGTIVGGAPECRGGDGIVGGVGLEGSECRDGGSTDAGVTASVGIGDDGTIAVGDAEGSSGVETGCRMLKTGVETVASQVIGSQSLRGKNWSKNQAKKRKNKDRGKSTPSVLVVDEVVDEKEIAIPEWRRKGVGIHRGAFSGCTSEVQQELRDTRAKMLVERNKTALVRAEVERRKMEANLSSRTYELQVEAERLKLDAAREKIIADKLAKLPAGYAETVASEGLASCVPSLSDGSVSPNSSISVAEVHRMMKSIADLTVRVAELTAQNQEDYVKKQAVIVQKDEELRAMEKKLAISDMKNRTNFGGEWASSSYDDDY